MNILRFFSLNNFIYTPRGFCTLFYGKKRYNRIQNLLATFSAGTNSTSTGIRKQAGQVRLKELQGTMNALYSQLTHYQNNPSDVVTVRMLKGLLSKTSKFADFTRSYARDHGYEAFIQ